MSTAPRADDGSPFTWMADAYLEVIREKRDAPHGILVTATLKNGRQFFSRGMFTHHSPEVPGIVMLQGNPEDSAKAMVVRDEEIVSIEFQIMPPPESESDSQQFGFYPRKQ